MFIWALVKRQQSLNFIWHLRYVKGSGRNIGALTIGVRGLISSIADQITAIFLFEVFLFYYKGGIFCITNSTLSFVAISQLSSKNNKVVLQLVCSKSIYFRKEWEGGREEIGFYNKLSYPTSVTFTLHSQPGEVCGFFVESFSREQ